MAVKSNSNGLCGFVGLWIITRQPEHILLQMDPITIVSAVAAAAQLAGSTASIGLKLFRFYCNVKDAPRKSKELCEEISELSAVIENLSQILTELGNSEIVNVISINSLEKYSQFLDEVRSQVHLDKGDVKKRLKWPLSTKENEELISKSERYKSTFEVALGIANLKVGSVHMYLT